MSYVNVIHCKIDEDLFKDSTYLPHVLLMTRAIADLFKKMFPIFVYNIPSILQ